MKTIIKPCRKINIPQKNIIFTFDDGPNEKNDVTIKILNILKKYNIKAYFCVIGKQVEKNPTLLKMIYDEGHIIVNHSYSHPMPLFASSKKITSEIEKTDQAIGKALNINGYTSKYVRPPFAILTKTFEKIIKEKEIKIAELSFLSFLKVDSEFSPDNCHKLLDYYIKKIKKNSGGMILLHDGCFRNKPIKESYYTDQDKCVNRSWVPDALEKLILHFKKLDYTFTTLPIDQ